MTKLQQVAIHEACKALQASQRAMLGAQHGAWVGTAHMEKAIRTYLGVVGSSTLAAALDAPKFSRFVSVVTTPNYLAALDADGNVWRYQESFIGISGGWKLLNMTRVTND